MSIEYNFKYMPLVGKLSGESMVKQTETAINEIAKIVNDNSAQAEIINTLAETANANSVEALEKAEEALNTSSRVYIKETLAVNLNNYCESQLIYINNAASQNLPIAHKGFLEVKTNDDKTQATQVFADDVDRKFYVRTGAITATTVGDATTYTASYGAWVDIPNITDLDNYLALVGGTMSGDIQFSASEWKIKGSDLDNDAELSIVGATDNLNGSSLNLYGRNHTESGAFELNANNGTYTKTLKGTATGNLTWDGNVSATAFIGNLTGIASGNLPLSGGTVTGNITIDNDNAKTIYTDANIGSSAFGFVGDVDDYGTAVLSKTGSFNDSLLIVRSSEQSTDPRFQLRAGNGTTTKDLVGKPNGTLTWDGDDIALAENVLALSGGTMTGNISWEHGAVGYKPTGHVSPDPCKQLMVTAGEVDEAWNSPNAKIALHIYDSTGTNSAEDGSFTIQASDGTNIPSLVGRPDGDLTWNGWKVFPVGVVQAFAGSSTPSGWLLCDGSAVSRTTYAKLFSVIGTTYGSGNGSTTFNLPNLTNRFIQGNSSVGSVKSAGLPNITGAFTRNGDDQGSPDIDFTGSGAIRATNYQGSSYYKDVSNWTVFGGFTFNASLSNNIYGASSTVQPPALTMRYIIKY